MPPRTYTGRQSCRLSEFHMGLHEQAYQRATEFNALLKAGLSQSEVARRYGISPSTVRNALKRQGML